MMSQVDTELPADSVEFCPAPRATHIFVVGTYKLEEFPPVTDGQDVDGGTRLARRWGRCLVYETDEIGDRWWIHQCEK